MKVALKKYEDWLKTLNADQVATELGKLDRVKTLLIDYDDRGATLEDWSRVNDYEFLAHLRLMSLKETHWYDPIKRMLYRT